MSRLDLIDQWVGSWAFWLPYMLGFSTGGLIGMWLVMKADISSLASRLERKEPDEKPAP